MDTTNLPLGKHCKQVQSSRHFLIDQSAMRIPDLRLIFILIFLASIGLIGGGLWLQYARDLEPCAMCILQRYAFVAIGLIALVAAFHHPAKTGTRIYGALILLGALAGGGVAARQAWMQRFPSREIECGPGLEYMIDAFPLTDALPMIFKGGGDCSKVQWTFLGGTIPEWALVWFVIFALAALWVLVRASRSKAG